MKVECGQRGYLFAEVGGKSGSALKEKWHIHTQFCGEGAEVGVAEREAPELI